MLALAQALIRRAYKYPEFHPFDISLELVDFPADNWSVELRDSD
jgi:hypothetical protein